MGRVQPGMEDDGPVADACGMPSFIGRSEEEGRVRLSRSLETSFSDGKVQRPVADELCGVGRSDSRLSLDGGGGRSGGGEGKDAGGNNNNNCNGGERRRRASAVEILRRNFGVVKSPSLRFPAGRRMQENNQSSVNSRGHGGECGECKKSDVETGDAGIKNEPTPSELSTSDPYDFEWHRARDTDGSPAIAEESLGVKQHVYCTVYCIANETHGAESAHRRDDEAGAPDPPGPGSETEREAGSSPEPPPYTLDDLVDPFGDISNQLYKDQAGGAGRAVQGCRVCLEDKTIAPLLCCRMAVCDECLKLYVSSQVRVAKAHISCPIPECSGYLKESVVVSHLANEDVAKYRYFLELNQLDSSTKPCPQCSDFTSLKKHNNNQSEHKYKIQCENCQFVWCFRCHAPWHNGIKCRDYRKGDKLLRTWASVIEHGQRNAQKCPQCKIHIQRTEGCDHMTCTQCNTNFCYRCGERYRHLRFFGDHTSNLSVFGCKYRYLPDKPHLRRFVRGSVCATKVLIAPVVIVLVVVLGALALVIGLVAFPVYYVCKRRKKQRTLGSGRWI